MALASLALRTTNVTISNASVELRTTAGVIARVLEWSVVQVTGTASSYGFGRPNAQGVTPATTSTFQRDNSADPVCVTTASLTWGTSPTAPTNYHRRWNSAATIGVGIVFTFPRALVVPVSASLVVFNITGTVALDVNFAIDEQEASVGGGLVVPPQPEDVVAWITVRQHANGMISTLGMIGDVEYAKQLLDEAKEAIGRRLPANGAIMVPNRDVDVVPNPMFKELGDIAKHQRGDP